MNLQYAYDPSNSESLSDWTDKFLDTYCKVGRETTQIDEDALPFFIATSRNILNSGNELLIREWTTILASSPYTLFTEDDSIRLYGLWGRLHFNTLGYLPDAPNNEGKANEGANITSFIGYHTILVNDALYKTKVKESLSIINARHIRNLFFHIKDNQDWHSFVQTTLGEENAVGRLFDEDVLASYFSQINRTTSLNILHIIGLYADIFPVYIKSENCDIQKLLFLSRVFQRILEDRLDFGADVLEEYQQNKTKALQQVTAMYRQIKTEDTTKNLEALELIYNLSNPSDFIPALNMYLNNCNSVLIADPAKLVELQ